MTSSDPVLLVLHGLRLRGFAATSAVAELFGEPPGEVQKWLVDLAERGFVVQRDGPRCGWALTVIGQAEHERLLAEELDGSGQRELVADCHQTFQPLNQRLLTLCTRWQVRSDGEAQVLNDHLDLAYDQAILAELAAVDFDARPITSKLGSALERFAIHAARLDHALAKVLAGDHDWFTRPLIDSYHTVWFELHEDLLLTLGLDRTCETP